MAAADGVFRIVARDDGVGGADPSRGSGLVGLRDRIDALAGTIAVRSPRGERTTVVIALRSTARLTPPPTSTTRTCRA